MFYLHNFRAKIQKTKPFQQIFRIIRRSKKFAVDYFRPVVSSFYSLTLLHLIPCWAVVPSAFWRSSSSPMFFQRVASSVPYNHKQEPTANAVGSPSKKCMKKILLFTAV